MPNLGLGDLVRFRLVNEWFGIIEGLEALDGETFYRVAFLYENLTYIRTTPVMLPAHRIELLLSKFNMLSRREDFILPASSSEGG